MENSLLSLTPLFSGEHDLISLLIIIGAVGIGLCLVYLIGKWIFGRNSALNQSVCTAVGILCTYVMGILVYASVPGSLSRYLTSLPFVSFSEEYLHLFPIASTGYSELCSQILSMIILVLLFNLMDDFLPTGGKLAGWLLYRFLTIIMATVLHSITMWALELILPGVLLVYAPMILLSCLIIGLVFGALNLLLSLVLTVINPIFGILYTFFFSSKFGKHISKAVLTTFLLLIITALLQKYGFGTICISSSALSGCALLAVLLALWRIIGGRKV